MKRKKDGGTLRWIWTVSGSAKWWILLLGLIRVAQSCVCISFAFALSDVVNSAAAGLRDAFRQDLILFVSLSLLSMLLMIAGRYVEERGKVALERRFRLRTFSQLLRRDYARVSGVHSSEWITRITSDVQVVESALVQIVPNVSGMLVRIFGAVIALFQIIPAVIWLLIPGGLLILTGSHIFRKWVGKNHKAVQQADGRVRVFLQERLSSLLVIRTFTQEEAAVGQAGDRMKELGEARMRRAGVLLFGHSAVSGAFAGIQALGVGLCGWGILQGTLTYGTMSSVLYLVNLLDAPLSTISSVLGQYSIMTASAERLMEVEAYPLDSAQSPFPQEEIRTYYAERFDAMGLENACFSYEEDGSSPVLQNLNLEIHKGEFVAFTGGSGCGKSTTLKLLLKLYPLHEGSAYLRDADGTQRPMEAVWRGLFAYVPQGNHLLSGTIRECLAFGDPKLMKQEDAIRQALRIACAEKFVDELPDGLETFLGERGSGLSEGQMQRIAIARALLSDRPVLLLDEATSALDGQTEMQLLENLRSMTDRTLLIVTHREAALEVCDKHIRFEKMQQS
ncbi:MAG: ABC transporter ATP-binding protein [Ruminococcaceae bacterium]|nr:ABC transporter ATP-binding protein [Oscillospiraceae bacterium]